MVVFAPMFALYAALQLLFMATLVDNPVNLPVVQILGLAAPSQIHFIAGKIVSLAATEWSISPLVTLFVNGFKLMFICSGNVGSGLFTTMRLNTMFIMLQVCMRYYLVGLQFLIFLQLAIFGRLHKRLQNRRSVSRRIHGQTVLRRGQELEVYDLCSCL